MAVEAQLAAGQMDEAASAAAELAALADRWKTPIHQARAATSAGVVAAARGERGAALDLLRAAVEWWRQVPAPYDEAVSRVALAKVEAPAARVVQLETALEAFVRLGATIDTERILGQLGRAQSSERIAVAMMFTDIEGSTAMLASLGDEAWLAVLRRHDATLRSLFATHRGEVYTGTGDGFFVGFQSVDNALDVRDCYPSSDGRGQDPHWDSLCRGEPRCWRRSVAAAYTRRRGSRRLGAGGDVVASTSTLALATMDVPHRGGTDDRAQGAPRRDGGGDTGARCPRLRATQPSRLPQDVVDRSSPDLPVVSRQSVLRSQALRRSALPRSARCLREE